MKIRSAALGAIYKCSCLISPCFAEQSVYQTCVLIMRNLQGLFKAKALCLSCLWTISVWAKISLNLLLCHSVLTIDNLTGKKSSFLPISFSDPHTQGSNFKVGTYMYPACISIHTHLDRACMGIYAQKIILWIRTSILLSIIVTVFASKAMIVIWEWNVKALL